jgi:hypothetical protein
MSIKESNIPKKPSLKEKGNYWAELIGSRSDFS